MTRRSVARRCAVALAMMLLLAACSRVTEPAPYGPAMRLAGAWRWVSSVDVHTRQVHTPDSEGFNATVVFLADSDHAGRFLYSRNLAPSVQGRFTIGSEDLPGNDFVVVNPGFDFLRHDAWLGVGNDTLRLDGVSEGGFVSTYARTQLPTL